MKTNLLVIAIVCFVQSITAQLDIKVEKLEHKRSDGEIVKYKKMTVGAFYNGKDLLVQNPFGGNGVGFCVTQVKVNGNTTADEINASIFRINLELHNLKKGEQFKLDIFYKDSCGAPWKPLMMNPGAIQKVDPTGNNMLTLNGTNYNASLLATNPRSGKGNYGVKEVTVNGKKVEGIMADVFEVNFFKMGIKYQDPVKVEFKYESGCDPFIINPDVISF